MVLATQNPIHYQLSNRFGAENPHRLPDADEEVRLVSQVTTRQMEDSLNVAETGHNQISRQILR